MHTNNACVLSGQAQWGYIAPSGYVTTLGDVTS